MLGVKLALNHYVGVTNPHREPSRGGRFPSCLGPWLWIRSKISHSKSMKSGNWTTQIWNVNWHHAILAHQKSPFKMMVLKLSSTLNKPTAPRSPKGPPGSPSSSILRSFAPEVVWLTQWYPEATWQIFPFMRPSNLWKKWRLRLSGFTAYAAEAWNPFSFWTTVKIYLSF